MKIAKLTPVTALLAASAALASPSYDGSWDLTYTELSGKVEVCVFVDEGDVEACYPISVNAVLEAGTVSEQTLQNLADDVLTGIEETTGRDLPTQAEVRIEAAIETLYGQMEDHLGQALEQMPSELDLRQPSQSPETVLATFYGGAFEGTSMPGLIDPHTGDYDIAGLFVGSIDAEEGYEGQGACEIRIDQSLQEQGITLKVEGQAAARYRMAQSLAAD